MEIITTVTGFIGSDMTTDVDNPHQTSYSLGMGTLDIDRHGHLVAIDLCSYSIQFQFKARRLCACALCFRWDVRLDVRFSLGRTFRRTFKP